jgi:hypothetical protein
VSWGALLVRGLVALPGAVAALASLPGAIRDGWRGRRPAAPPDAATGLPHLHSELQRRASHGHQALEGGRSYWCPGPHAPNACARCRAEPPPSSPRAVTHDASGRGRR